MKWRGGDGVARNDATVFRHVGTVHIFPSAARPRVATAACRVTTALTSGVARATRTAPPRGGGGHSAGARSGAAFARAALGTPRSRRSGRHRASPPPPRPGTARSVVSPPRASVNNRGCSPGNLPLPGRGRARSARRRSPDRSGAPGGTRGPSSAATATRTPPRAASDVGVGRARLGRPSRSFRVLEVVVALTRIIF